MYCRQMTVIVNIVLYWYTYGRIASMYACFQPTTEPQLAVCDANAFLLTRRKPQPFWLPSCFANATLRHVIIGQGNADALLRILSFAHIKTVR